MSEPLAAVKSLYRELGEVLEVAIGRGEELGYADESYRERLAQIQLHVPALMPDPPHSVHCLNRIDPPTEEDR